MSIKLLDNKDKQELHEQLNLKADKQDLQVQQEQLIDKVDKTGITLGLHTDGLMYVFVDGVPIGNGVELLNIDEKYNPKSLNAQSGLAVDEAIKAAVRSKCVVAALSAPLSETLDTDNVGKESGYGCCTVIYTKNTCTVFDLGNDKEPASTLITYLKSKNISRINALFISHFHSDHFSMNGFNELLENGYIDRNSKVVLPHSYITKEDFQNSIEDKSYFDENLSKYETKYRELIGNLETCGIPYIEPEQEGANVAVGDYGEINVNCYNVCENNFINYAGLSGRYNNYSMVNLVQVENCKILITGDIENIAVSKLWNENGILSRKDIDIMSVPHHSYLDNERKNDELPIETINNIRAKFAYIPWAYDYDGLSIERATPFVKTLLNNNCNVSVTYAGDDISRNVVYQINSGNIALAQSGLPAGDNILYTEGIEYLTDERFMGQPVFTKLITHSLENEIISDEVIPIKHDIENLQQVIDLKSSIIANENCSYSLPYYNPVSDTGLYVINVGSQEIYIANKNSNWGSGRKFYFQMKYIKASVQ